MIPHKCPNCGARLSVPEAEAGLAALCLRCGTRYTVPAAGAGDAADPGATRIGEAITEPDDAPADPAENRAPGYATAAETATGRWLRPATIAAVVLALGALAFALAPPIVRRASRPAPDAIDFATARGMKEQAEALAVDGRLEDAHRQYRDLFDRAGDRDPGDPRTRQLLDAARAHQAKLYEVLLARIAEAPPPHPAGPHSEAPEVVHLDSGTAEEPAPEAPVRVPGQETPVTAPPTTPVASAPPSPSTPAPQRAPEPAPVTQPSAVAEATAPATAPAAATAFAPGTTVPLPRPAPQPNPEPPPEITDEQIGTAIRRGVDYLLAQFSDRTHALSSAGTLTEAHGGGENALAVYALLQCGLALPDDPRLNVRGDAMRARIESMKLARLTEGQPQVYALGLRATALSLHNRKEDQQQLRQDVDLLLRSHSQGGYWYLALPQGRSSAKAMFDNSNSQYGLLGVWSGAEAGLEVPQSYWKAVEQHWQSTQSIDGTWDYAGIGAGGSLSMTVAGIASLFVTHDYLDGPRFGAKVGRPPFSPPLKRGLDWLETGDNYAGGLPGMRMHVAYTMYGIERVGLASGFKYFGAHDWYRQLSREAVYGQGGDGSWNGNVIDTSYVLLFLARGRHPILINKLRFDRRGAGPAQARPQAFWANRPRDAANLARFASRQLERELNWQVVPLDRPWQDWLDSPILYLASHKPVELTRKDYDNLRAFVGAGGLLFTHADGAAFNAFAEDLANRLFPKYELRDLRPDHDLYSVVFKVDEKERPRLRVAENGSRLLMVHSTSDVARAWQTRDAVRRKNLFQFGTNLFIYAAGKHDLRNRLESTFVSDPGPPQVGQIAVARLSYPGNWDPEPFAWTRFSRWFQRQTGTGVAAREVKLPELKPGDVTLAHLTGTARHDFGRADAAAVRAFVEAGGVLLIDQCGGTGVFDASAQGSLLAAAFPGEKLRPLTTDHPLFTAGRPGTHDLAAVKLRPYVVERLGKEANPRLSALKYGKGHVLFTPLDLTSGLLGTRTWGISGYEPEYAQALLQNVLLWTVDGQPGEKGQ